MRSPARDRSRDRAHDRAEVQIEAEIQVEGEPGSGTVCLNGAAARLVQPGDKIIIISYADYDQAELDGFAPTIVHVDTSNRPLPALT